LIFLIQYAESQASAYAYKVLEMYPHDTSAFTEGLCYVDGVFYEGTGLYGASSLRRVNVSSGQVLKKLNLNQTYFGEGVTVFDNKIYQLTWKEGVVFVYDFDTWDLIKVFQNPLPQGWGLTHNGTYLIMSDGSSYLYYIDPETFTVVSNISVTNGMTPITNLNELEYINGVIWANVWLTYNIVLIDPMNGNVTAYMNFIKIRPKVGQEFNGIAYDAVNDRTFVTGKKWPTMFQVEAVPK